uniref:PPM-type phosphatase domain-containing protein n=1 Tax=Daucus carota subsp. sativus TaxID=79200 RepID=A0A162A184_DAUCS
MGSSCSALCRGDNDKHTNISSVTTYDFKFNKSGGVDISALNARLIANGASNIACLHTQQGKKGTNQDAMIAWEYLMVMVPTPYGHLVARKVRDNLPNLLSTQWNENLNNDHKCVDANDVFTENGNAAGNGDLGEHADDGWSEPLEGEEIVKRPEMYWQLKQSMLKAFKLMDKELMRHPAIDCFCSGSTTVALVKQGQDLVIGNVGDSRAVLATRDNNNSLTAVQLTIDLKPNLPREAARITQCKGRVFALQDEPDVPRVWLPNSDTPGLAMARAFGDFCLKDFGLISMPEVYYHQVTESDEFVILATDGVWDVISNKEAVDIVASAPGHSTAARALIDCATRAWRLKYPTSKIDDCAVVCLYLEHACTTDVAKAQSNVTSTLKEEVSMTVNDKVTDIGSVSPSHSVVLEHSGTVRCSEEIVPVAEASEDKNPEKSMGQSKRSIADCISTAEEEEWSALEGITRVNSLLSIPRFLSADKGSASWRKVMWKS